MSSHLATVTPLLNMPQILRMDLCQSHLVTAIIQVGRSAVKETAASIICDLISRLRDERFMVPMAETTKQLHSAVSSLGKVSQ